MDFRFEAENLLIAIPEFKLEYLDVNHKIDFDYSYLLYGDFALFINREIHKDPPNLGLIERCYDYINILGESKDKEIVNLLVVGVLEVLTDNKELQEVSVRLLKGVSKKYYMGLFESGLFVKMV